MLIFAFGFSGIATAQATDLGKLFDQANSSAKHPAGSVEVVGWIDNNADGPVLRINLAAVGGARLVADPGIRIEPVADSSYLWADAQPIEQIVPGQDYFDVPQTIDIPLTTQNSGMAEADVLFAYCLVDDICLFGEERVSALLGAR